MPAIDKSLYASGIRFECTGCGECCKTRGRYSYVYVSLAERRALARHLGISTAQFTRDHCRRTDGWYHLANPSGDCQFLDGKRCTVYAARPEQCKSWPFWPNVMNKKTWEQEAKPGCEGIGRGRLYTLAEIEVTLGRELRRANKL